MVSFKNSLLLALAASIQASPLASSGSATPTESRGHLAELPEGTVDFSNDTALIEELFPKYGLKTFFEEATSPSRATEGGIGIMSGACDQGNCPDYFKAFDLLYTLTMVPGFGVSQSYDIRVDECGQCHRKSVGSGSAGCYELTGCGRPQSICVDPLRDRAHRIWKDANVKTCYSMQYRGLGTCGIQTRELWSPVREVACNW